MAVERQKKIFDVKAMKDEVFEKKSQPLNKVAPN